MSLHYKSNYSKFDQVLQIRIIIYTVSNKHHQIYYELYSQSLIFFNVVDVDISKKSLIFVDEGSIEDQWFQSPNTPAHAPTTIRNYLGGGQQGTEAPSSRGGCTPRATRVMARGSAQIFFILQQFLYLDLDQLLKKDFDQLLKKNKYIISR